MNLDSILKPEGASAAHAGAIEPFVWSVAKCGLKMSVAFQMMLASHEGIHALVHSALGAKNVQIEFRNLFMGFYPTLGYCDYEHSEGHQLQSAAGSLSPHVLSAIPSIYLLSKGINLMYRAHDLPEGQRHKQVFEGYFYVVCGLNLQPAFYFMTNQQTVGNSDFANAADRVGAFLAANLPQAYSAYASLSTFEQAAAMVICSYVASFVGYKALSALSGKVASAYRSIGQSIQSMFDLYNSDTAIK